MIGFGLTIFGAALAAAALYSVYLNLLQRWKSRSFARAPGPSIAPWWDIFGIAIPLGFDKALDEDRLLEYIKMLQSTTQEAQGRKVTTMEMTVLGRKSFMTTDVKNIQAVLAHQFNDFGLGEDRIGSFLPMLGVGIVSVFCLSFSILSTHR